MKGLIRNHFYMILPTLKAAFMIALVLQVALIIALISLPDSTTFVNFVVYGAIGGFSSLPFTFLYNTGRSKWGRFELTTPVSRRDIIKSRYIFFLLIMLLVIVVATVLNVSIYVITGSLDLERAFMGYTIGVVLLIAVTSFVHPLILLLGIDKGQLIYMISIAVCLGLFAAPSMLFGDWLNTFSSPELVNFVYRASTVGIAFLLFAVSYVISVKIYEQKDL